MSVLKHFGNLKNINDKPDLKSRLTQLQAKINALVESEYMTHQNSYSQSTYSPKEFKAYVDEARKELSYNSSKAELVMTSISKLFNSEFEGHTYLSGVKMDESRGRILKSDIIRYIDAYFGFLGLFKVYNDDVNYSILENMEIECVDIPIIREFKINYLKTLLNLKTDDAVKDYFNNPIYDYVKMDIPIDHSYIMYEMFIDADKKITYSNFYNAYVMDCFKVENKYASYIIYKLSDFEVSMTEYFNNELKEYMHKEDYERVIAYYVGAFQEMYSTDLYESIKKDPVITKYMMIKAIEEFKECQIVPKGNSDKIKDVRLSEILA